ncbi:MAG TPA: DNA methyltransferase [Candidatus Limnocylindrales bacterium]|nr:DNA methyltransferase [Candidatus Limnocylindrales bacterium]
MSDIETGVIYCDDNLWRLSQLPAESIDLAYLDPPFFSNRTYEVIWGDEAERRSFEDRWAGGIEVYVDWMRERLIEIYRVMKATASLYLHCDPSASHYLRVALDGIFGRAAFKSEIIWKRSSAHSDTRQGRRQHGRIHDVILFYSKGSTWTWNPVYQAYDPEYVRHFYRHIEAGSGRRYTLSDITAPGGGDPAKRNPHYSFMGIDRYWRYSRESMDKLVADGRIIQSRPGAVPRQKRYLDEMPGVALQDLWTDIPPVSAQGQERVGYPTQKPVALLRRVLESSTNRGDVVLDAFCGCGTTLVAAESLGRGWVGIDISPTAVQLMQQRLEKMGVTVKVVGLPDTDESLRALKPFEFQNWVIHQMNGAHNPRKTGDGGVDGYSWYLHEPIQVKQLDKVGREIVDTFETAVERSHKKKGYIVAFGFTKGAHDEVARVKRTRGLEIVLKPVAELLKEDRRRRSGILPPQMEPDARPTLWSDDDLPSVAPVRRRRVRQDERQGSRGRAVQAEPHPRVAALRDEYATRGTELRAGDADFSDEGVLDEGPDGPQRRATVQRD